MTTTFVGSADPHDAGTSPAASGGRPARRSATVRSLRRQPFFVIGVSILSVIIAATLAADWLTLYGPNTIDLKNLETPPGGDHLLGTDALGRDVFSRLLHGGRISVLVGICAVLLQVVIGVTMGASAGYFSGRIDAVIMRLTEIVMCFPFYAIAITLAAIFGASIWNVILIIGILNWTGLARLVRAELLSLREREYVLAAQAFGVRPITIILRHLLRNAYGPILVNATLAVASGILAEAALSFLGLGVAQPEASWGNMLTAAQSMRVLSHEWWLWVPPGAAIALMVLAINFVGEALAQTLTQHENDLLRDLQSARRLRRASSRRRTVR